MSGMRFGNLLVTNETQNIAGIVYWWCRCDCGTLKPVNGQNLRSRGVISCGCARQGPTTRRTRVIPSISDANEIDRRHQLIDVNAPKPEREKVKAQEISYEARMDLAKAMRRSLTRWRDIAECCGDDVAQTLREAQS
ncbi:hypothetical protein UFOVP296_17 [uncultured Caudovirales phage]|uniref:Uncharacterized protein n=1 Tax=uncultured Caudovirales phage TaxID=2100421 RepID=A0A6J5LP52_9CAUD|nr:hypothetical protein UFOVP296_17 [uncultured Caudovirales phage]CAB4170082.1 hypothetical protein UFOVP912_36 [uncultured Caudovirales phage]CAB4199232.1 hypothetical protein UFOVP1334_24 [uncultured Caudovirales phage]